MRDEDIAKMTKGEKREALSKIEGHRPKDIPEISSEKEKNLCEEPYENHNQQTLCQRAEELGIEGRSIMSKAELIEAIREKSK